MSIEAIHSIGYGIVAFVISMGIVASILMHAEPEGTTCELRNDVWHRWFSAWIPMSLLITAATILLTFNP